EEGEVIDVGLVGARNDEFFASVSQRADRAVGPFVRWFYDKLDDGKLVKDYIHGELSTLALIEINLRLRSPDLIKAELTPRIILGTALQRGTENASVLMQFLAGGGKARFQDGSATIETDYRSRPSFRHHPTTDLWLNTILYAAVDSLRQKIMSGEESLDCGQSVVFDLKTVIPQDDPRSRLLYQVRKTPFDKEVPPFELDFFDTIVGGV